MCRPPNTLRARKRCGGGAVVAALAIAALWRCAPETRGANTVRGRAGNKAATQPDSPPDVRPVRVLVLSGVDEIRLRSTATLFIRTGEPSSSRVIPADTNCLIRIRNDRMHVDHRACTARSVVVEPEGDDPIRLSVRREGAWRPPGAYPGTLRLTMNDDAELDVVNRVDVEEYVSSVVASEVWPTFHDESFRAQAVVARTFVLHQMIRRADAPFDVPATERAQVYGGIRNDRTALRARRATQFTRGVVCTWNDHGVERLFSTYYSAACGGHTQSAAIFGSASDVPPLRGGVSCDHCAIAPGNTYRWGPVRLARELIRKQLLERYPQWSALGGLKRIDVAEETPFGRPIALRVHFMQGRPKEILAERFRLAIGAHVLRSTDFQVSAQGDDIVFSRGRGFGHGLGLCQWGMEGQARRGSRAADILQYYYPGTNITRVY